MPRMMKVLDGPNFRRLVFGSTVLNDTGFTSLFTMDMDIPEGCIVNEGSRNKFELSIISIGRLDSNKDEFIVVGNQWGLTHTVPTTRFDWYYVVRYNARTRKGHCVEYTKEEFFAQSIIREMFG